MNKRILDVIACSISSTFGSGLSPFAPGTVGAAIALVGLWFLNITNVGLLLLTILFYSLGVLASTRAEKIWGIDPARVNFDEFVGMMLSVLFLPKILIIYLAAFIFFRIFDIIKPFPVNRAEKWRAGWGIMTDDILAAFYANLSVQIICRVIWPYA